MEGDTCKECGRWTDQGIKMLQENSRLHPVYNTDFSKPLSVLIENIRSQIAKSRGQLGDISFTGMWEQSIKEVEGLLTCGLIALWHIKEEMEKVEARSENENSNT